MIIGIGIDLVNVSRFDSWTYAQFERVFTKNELLCARKHKNSIEKFAKMWAVKEAVVKAIGTGFADGVSFSNIDCVFKPSTMPEVVVSGRVLEIIKSRADDYKIHISISDDGGMSVAVAIIESC